VKRPHPRYRIVLEATPSLVRPGDPKPPAPALRLGHLLKFALRALQPGAVRAEALPGEAGPPAQADRAGGVEGR
jgi:hypothetical protein